MRAARPLLTAVLLLPHWVGGLLELAALQAWRLRDRIGAARR